MQPAISRRCALAQAAGLAVCAATPQRGSAQAAPDAIGAAEFWAYYHQGRFVQLTRGAHGYQGEVRLDEPRGLPRDLLSSPQYRRVHVTRAVLVAFDDTTAPEFGQLSFAQRGWQGLWASTSQGAVHPWQDAPFGPERMKEIVAAVPDPGNVESAARLLQRLLPSNSKAALATTLAWLLGECRSAAGGDALMKVLQTAAASSPALSGLPFTLVDAALAALSKVDSKIHLPRLLALMQTSNVSTRYKIGRLLARLLSTQHMLSLNALGDDFGDPKVWARVVADRRASSALEWQRQSAQSLYWDLRGLAALRLPHSDGKILEELADDEAGPVRRIARARLRSIPSRR